MVTFNTRLMAWVLGLLGLIPFVLCALGALFGIGLFELDAVYLFITYSVVILSFLSGTLWANAAHQGLSRAAAFTMIISNGFCLSAWLVLLMNNEMRAVLLLMVAFPLLCVAEGRVKESQHASYIRLRIILTWVVFATHLMVAIVLF